MGTSGSIYIQDAMLNQGLVAYPYVETTTAPVAGGILEDMPRLDYSNGSCPSLLLEPSRTNLVTHSEYFGSTSTYNLASVSLTNIQSPEGYPSVYKITESSSNTSHLLRSVRPNILEGSTNTISAFLKGAERTKAGLLFGGASLGLPNIDYRLGKFDLTGDGSIIQTPTDGSATIKSVGNGWYRCSISVTSNVTSQVWHDTAVLNDNGDLDYVGDNTSGIYVWGTQLEQDATYPTSYIPTYGVSQTRLGDIINIPSSADLSIPSDSWTILWDLSDESISTGGRWLSDGLNNINLYPVIPNKSRVYWRGIGQYIAEGGGSKIIARYDGTTATEFHDGINKGSASYSGQLPFNLINEIQLYTGKYIFNKIVIFPTALSDEACIELTTIS